MLIFGIELEPEFQKIQAQQTATSSQNYQTQIKTIILPPTSHSEHKHREASEVPPMLEDLIRWLLRYDPLKRPDVRELIRHPYVCGVNDGTVPEDFGVATTTITSSTANTSTTIISNNKTHTHDINNISSFHSNNTLANFKKERDQNVKDEYKERIMDIDHSSSEEEDDLEISSSNNNDINNEDMYDSEFSSTSQEKEEDAEDIKSVEFQDCFEEPPINMDDTQDQSKNTEEEEAIGHTGDSYQYDEMEMEVDNEVAEEKTTGSMKEIIGMNGAQNGGRRVSMTDIIMRQTIEWISQVKRW
jgi:serine/threonine protein kinase